MKEKKLVSRGKAGSTIYNQLGDTDPKQVKGFKEYMYKGVNYEDYGHVVYRFPNQYGASLVQFPNNQTIEMVVLFFPYDDQDEYMISNQIKLHEDGDYTKEDYKEILPDLIRIFKIK